MSVTINQIEGAKMYRAEVADMLRQLADGIEDGRFKMTKLKTNIHNNAKNTQNRNLFIEVTEQWGVPPGQDDYETMMMEFSRAVNNGNS